MSEVPPPSSLPGMNTAIVENEFGYFELAEMPTTEQLRSYYSGAYYQQSSGHYQKVYSDEEREFILGSIRMKCHIVQQFCGHASSLLDVGAGEGFLLDHLDRLGWRVAGLEFSDFAVRHFHPHLLSKLVVGDIFDNLTKIQRTYDLIVLDNVLEHVVSPKVLLESLQAHLTENGLLVIEVPNDFSAIQLEAKRQQLIERDFWVRLPDHLSYFNHQGLVNLARACGYEQIDCISDFPIDWDLFSPPSNYVVDPDVGKAAHLKRVRLQNLFLRRSLPQSVGLFRQLAAMGLGRSICGFFRKSRSGPGKAP